MKEFIKDILLEDFGDEYENIFNQSDLLQYLDLKTSAIFGNSKTRKSLANIYAIYSILNFYIDTFYNDPEEYRKFQGYEFTLLLTFCRNQYGGEKIQNHALNSRLNGEFENKIVSGKNKGKPLVVINNGKYALHIDYIYVNGKDISKSVIKIIQKYVELLRMKDDKLINDLEALSDETEPEKKRERIKALIDEKSEARIFEIISYAILKHHYKETFVYIGYSIDELKKEYLELYKTGRTNANDGGIDFVMRPLGRFFQVTEVGNYDKYLLDIDKVLHFPITFVVKTSQTKEEVISSFHDYIEDRSGGMEIVKQRYINAIEEIITTNELHDWFKELDDNAINEILSDIILYYKIEMNLNDGE
jgi:hypothetical protein